MRDPRRSHIERPHALLVVERRLGDTELRWPAAQSGPSALGWIFATLALFSAPVILALNEVFVGAAVLVAVDVVGFVLIRTTSVCMRVERGLFMPREGHRFVAEDVKAIVVRPSFGAFHVVAEVEALLHSHVHVAYVRDASLAEAIAHEARALCARAMTGGTPVPPAASRSPSV